MKYIPPEKKKIHVTCPHFLRHFPPASIANSMQWEGVEALLHDCDENHVAIVYYPFPDPRRDVLMKNLKWTEMKDEPKNSLVASLH